MGDASRPVTLDIGFKDRYLEIRGGNELYKLETVEKLSDNSFIRAIEQIFFAIAQYFGLTNQDYSLAKFTIAAIDQQKEVAYYIINEKAFDSKPGILNNLITKSYNLSGEKLYTIQSTYIPEVPKIVLSENDQKLLDEVSRSLDNLITTFKSPEYNFLNKNTFSELKNKLLDIFSKIKNRQIHFSQKTFADLGKVKTKIDQFSKKLMDYPKNLKNLQKNIDEYTKQKQKVDALIPQIQTLSQELKKLKLPEQIVELLDNFKIIKEHEKTITRLEDTIEANKRQDSEDYNKYEKQLRDLMGQLSEKKTGVELLDQLGKAYENRPTDPYYLKQKAALENKLPSESEITDLENQIVETKTKLLEIETNKVDSHYKKVNIELQKQIENYRKINSLLLQDIISKVADTNYDLQDLKKVHEKKQELKKLTETKKKLNPDGFITSKLGDAITKLRSLNENMKLKQTEIVNGLNKLIRSFSSSPEAAQ